MLLFPLVQEMVRVDLRIQGIEIPSQDAISHDNVSMKVDAVLGQHDLDEMLSERKKLSTVELTENMVHAIAKQVEAERDPRGRRLFERRFASRRDVRYLVFLPREPTVRFRPPCDENQK